jgi:hypothetical protein
MLTRLLDWNRRRRQWNRDHVAAWTGWDTPGVSGFSPFQEKCEAELVSLLAQSGLALNERAVRGESEHYVHATVADTGWQVWIYLDQVQITGPKDVAVNLEQWSALTPAELISTFIVHVRRGLEERRS